MDQIFILKKLRKKITSQDRVAEKNKIKAKHNLTKLKAKVELLEGRATHYPTNI